MTLPFEANCYPMAPFDLPYAQIQGAWAAQRQTNTVVKTWPLLPPEPIWHLAASGFPGLADDGLTVVQADFERELERHQLAFLQYDLSYTAVPKLRQAITKLHEQISAATRMQALIIGVYGPVSLGLTLVNEHQTPLWHDPFMREVLVQHLHLRTAWLEQAFGAVVPATSICLLEPFWDSLHSPFVTTDEAVGIQALAEIGQTLQATLGLMATGSVDWPTVLATNVRLIICQPEQRSALLDCGTCLNDYFERGGIVAWAMLPTTAATLDQLALEPLMDSWDTLLRQALDNDVLNSRMLSGSLLTTNPGLRTQTTATADRVLGALATLSEHIRTRYKLS